MNKVTFTRQRKKFNISTEEEPLVISIPTIKLLLKQNTPCDLISLYCFYYYTAKWQKTNQPKAVNVYTKNVLKIGKDRLKKAQDTLINLGLIEKIAEKDEKGKIRGWYIKVNFIWKASSIGGFTQMAENPLVGQPTCGFQPTSALSVSNISALSVNTTSCGIGVKDFEEVFWKHYPKKTDKGKALSKWITICGRKDRPTKEQIISSIKQQKETDRWRNGYIPLPTTWLNQRRWLDDPKEMDKYSKQNNYQEGESIPDWAKK